MALSCNWPTKVITIPQSDLTLISGTYYTLDVTYYFQLLRELNGSAEGISQTIGTPLYNNTSPTTGTPRIVDIINGYTIQFEDLSFSVDFINGNTNWRLVEIRNSVSVGTNNVAAISGLDEAQSLQLFDIHKASFNRRKHDDVTNTITLYEDDKVTPHTVFDADDALTDISPQ